MTSELYMYIDLYIYIYSTDIRQQGTGGNNLEDVYGGHGAYRVT